MKQCKHEMLRGRKYIKCGRDGSIHNKCCIKKCPFYKQSLLAKIKEYFEVI